MNKKNALIFGISGQAGSYLAEFLLEKDYNVFGSMRRHSSPEFQCNRIDHIKDNLNIEYCDITDNSSVERLIKLSQPNEIYLLSAQSHVKISFDMPEHTIHTNCIGTLNVLENFRKLAPNAKLQFAASSEMFGNNQDDDGFQRESTKMTPVSPYGVSKVFGYNLVHNYRNAYNLFACSGIFFNYESERRGLNFVTNKIAKGVAEIKLGISKKLTLGNLDSFRDWGYAPDTVRAMWLMLQQENPDDYLIATEKCHSVRDFCDYAFSHVGLNYKDYVKQDPKFMRPEELDYLKGDASKAKKILNWEPTISFNEMVNKMVDYWIVKLS